MNPQQSSLTTLGRSYGLVEGELDAFSAGFTGIQPHPQTPRAYRIEAATEAERPRAFGCVELFLDDWTDPSSPFPIGINVLVGEQEVWIGESEGESLAHGFLRVLYALGRDVGIFVVWNGAGVVFHSFLRHIAPALALEGCVIEPLVSGADIKAIIIRGDHSQWILTDSGTMSGMSRIGQEGFCDTFGSSYLNGYSNVRRLWKAVDKLQDVLLSMTNVGLRPTIAAVSLKAARYHLPPGTKWYRPNLPIESVCRYGGAYRGGYVYYEDYRGPAHRIDVNRMYTSLLRGPLPGSCALTHAGEYLREKPGIFLCRVEGEGYFPVYISAFSVNDRRFHKQYTTRPAAWSWLPSSELVGMRALGYKIVAGLGFAFDTWVDLSGFAKQLLHHISSPSSTDAQKMVAKAIGNSLTGKLGQAPEHLNVSYSVGAPKGDWVPYVTVDKGVIPNLWVQKHLDFKGGQHVDSAAWLTAQGRGKVYGQLSRIRALGWRAVHVDTDGIIIDQDPRGILPLRQDIPGEWRYDGSDSDALVAKGKWYSFAGETHTAGLSGVTREQLEAVHYGRKVVIGRKVLSNPFGSSPTIQNADYHLGG